MPGHRILYFDAERLIAYQATGDRIVEVGVYRNDPMGQTAFASDLANAQEDIHYLVAELAEENYHINLVPFVKGRYREELLQQRLQKAFPNTDYRLTMSIGFEKINRLDEKLLIIGLTNSEIPDIWLRILHEHHIRVAGLYSTALLVPALLDQLRQDDAWTIVVTFSPGGMRLTLCEHNALRFSRLIVPPSFDPVDLAACYASETTKTIQYLLTARILPKNLSQITVFLIVPDIDRAIFERALSPGLSLYPISVTIETCCEAIGLKHYPERGLAAPIFCHLLAQKPSNIQFAPTRTLQHFRLSLLKRWLFRIMLFIVFCCFGITVYHAVEGFEHYRQLRALENENNNREQALHQIGHTLWGQPVDLTVLAKMTTNYDRILQRQAVDLRDWFARLDSINRIEPILHFEHIGWTITPLAPVTDDKTNRTNPDVSSDDEPLTVVMSFEGFIEFTGQTDDVSRRFADTLKRLGRFINDLEHQFGATATISKLPVDLSSSTSLVLDDDTFEQTRYHFAISCRFPLDKGTP